MSVHAHNATEEGIDLGLAPSLDTGRPSSGPAPFELEIGPQSDDLPIQRKAPVGRSAGRVQWPPYPGVRGRRRGDPIDGY
jgi:hypothetical protein